MSQGSEMEHLAQKKSAENCFCFCFFFKTILSDFVLERGPFSKTREVKPFILQRPSWRKR